jgi:hypothetical protein
VFTTDQGKKSIDIDKGDDYVIYDGSPMSLGRYYSFMINMAEWKLGELHYASANIKQAIAELCLQIRKQKGFVVG